VRAATGGCAPRVLLCAVDGGAAAGACDGVDIGRPPTDPDASPSFYRLADGAIAGAWHDPGTPGGPPAADFVPDGGTGTSGSDWAPTLRRWTCPVGWMLRPDGTCDPRLRDDCAAGSGPIPGGECTATAASDCPASEFADVRAERGTAALVYVRAGSDDATADGSLTRPYGSMGAAVRGVGAGGWVLVGAGSYTESNAIVNTVHVVGRCAASVSVHGAPGDAPTFGIDGMGAAVDLRGMTVDGNEIAVRVQGGAALRIRALRITRAAFAGVLAAGDGTTLDAQDLEVSSIGPHARGDGGSAIYAQASAVVRASRVFVRNVTANAVLATRTSRVELRDALLRPSDGATGTENGDGVWAESGAQVTLNGVTIERASDRGIVSREGAHIVATDVIVSETVGDARVTYPSAVQVVAPATIEMERVYVLRNAGVGIEASGSGAVARVRDCVVREIGAPAEADPASVYVTSGAVVELDGVRLERGRVYGVLAEGRGSQVRIHSTIISQFALGPDPSHGAGIRAAEAAVIADHVLIDDVARTGVTALGTSARVELTESVVRTVRPSARGTDGIGIVAMAGAQFALRWTVLTNIPQTAIFAVGARSVVAMDDSVVRHGRALGDGTLGRGANIESGASATFRRVLMDDNDEGGIFVKGEGSMARVEDSVVRGNVASQVGFRGRGVGVERGGRVEIVRSLIDDNRDIGVVGFGAGTTVQIENSAVRGTRSAAEGTGGAAVVVATSARLEARGLFAGDNRDIGIAAIGFLTEAALSDVWIEQVSPTTRGFGLGIMALDGASMVLERVVVRRATAAALGSISQVVGGTVAHQSTVTAHDLWIEETASGTLRIDIVDAREVPSGRPVAYGLHAGDDAIVDVSRAVVVSGGYGFAVGAGRLTLRDAVIVRQLDAFGARIPTNGMPALVLDSVGHSLNARDDIVDDSSLPLASRLPTPTAICEGGVCP